MNAEEIQLSKPNVLIVDDTEENLRLLSNHLYNKGINVIIAKDGKTALEIVNTKPPDLILLDIMMPGINGFKVCQELKKNTKTKNIPIIFLTAKTEINDIVKGFTIGAVDYITKPFNSTELLSRVFTHIELKKSKDIIKIHSGHVEELNAILNKKNKQLYKQNEELKTLNITKDKLFSIIAHDLKTPFNQLIEISELTLMDIDNLSLYDLKENIRQIHLASLNGENLLQNLLDWAKHKLGSIKFNPQKIILSKVINTTFIYLKDLANEKNITLVSNIKEDITVTAEDEMLNIIIRNLISNAIKFTNTGGRVEISNKANNNYQIITIEDNGIGITPEDLTKLFRMDENYSIEGTAQEKGTGIGLIICKEFIKKHEGKIWVESKLGEGSKFKFSIPI